MLNGFYRGFGYIKQSTKALTASDYLAAITPQKDTRDIHRILKSYLRKNIETMVKLPAFHEHGTLF
ncbi:hypothetical protein [Tenacibaculum sp. SG-28]|uniref:hypothetical protein n=1 Tax=Tenacibaculum sp. SG-28 TaxID=754426 RepID=UPI001E2BCA8A|nr:hypothetical protein [Tenacibaculum sp. SG-28]